MGRLRGGGVKRSALVVGFAALALQSCTIAYYDLRNKLENPGSAKPACDVRYSISLASASYTNTFGRRETDKRRMQQARDTYVADTGDVLRQKGCRTAYVENNEEATLEIRIERLAHISALPQEWLTGVSAGLIPSWGTRKSEYAYSFKDKASGSAYSYAVDTKSYNHLILFPVFWINFFTLDERRVYKDALTNFLEHS
jgi:hypothetical protein